jgi:hypothetical protein
MAGISSPRPAQHAADDGYQAKGDPMEAWETMQTATALVLAMTAALMSSGPTARHEVSSYLVEVWLPQPIDFGDALD